MTQGPSAAAEQGKIVITRATGADSDRITALAGARASEGGEPGPARDGGPAAAAFGEAAFRRRLTTAEQVYVARKDDEIVGFLIAHSDAQLQPDEWLDHRIKVALGAFLVIKQVCVSRAAAGSGIASLLYCHVLEQWDSSPVIESVAADPPDEASTRFHAALGFEELTRLTPPGGRERIVWVWRRGRESVLQAQYSTCVDLYKHEDTTNWQKVNSFFYITAALAAATGLTLANAGVDTERLSRGLAAVIAVIGFGVSVAFSQMLRYGQRYLVVRKQAVMALEERIVWHGGRRVVTPEAGGRHHDWLRRSPTGTIMVLMPAVVAACWLGVLGVTAAG